MKCCINLIFVVFASICIGFLNRDCIIKLQQFKHSSAQRRTVRHSRWYLRYIVSEFYSTHRILACIEKVFWDAKFPCVISTFYSQCDKSIWFTDVSTRHIEHVVLPTVNIKLFFTYAKLADIIGKYLNH